MDDVKFLSTKLYFGPAVVELVANRPSTTTRKLYEL